MHSHRLSAIAGPVTLLLLPKCPLCFATLLAGIGVFVPGVLGLSIAAAILVAMWLAFLLFMTRDHSRLRVWALLAAIVSFVAIGMQNRPLLWAGVIAMTVAGVVAARVCGKTRCEVRPASLDIHPAGAHKKRSQLHIS